MKLNIFKKQFEPPFMKNEYTEERLVAPGLPIKT